MNDDQKLPNDESPGRRRIYNNTKSTVESPYSLYLHAKYDRLQRGDTLENIKVMQNAILLALRSDEPLKDEIKTELLVAFESLCKGYEPKLFSVSKGEGAKLKPVLEICIQDAVNFVAGAEIFGGKKGKIEAEKLVSEEFGVTAKQARSWVKKYSPQLKSILPKDYKRLMEISAQRYKQEKLESKYAKTVQKGNLHTS